MNNTVIVVLKNMTRVFDTKKEAREYVNYLVENNNTDFKIYVGKEVNTDDFRYCPLFEKFVTKKNIAVGTLVNN